jgi:hypothetical protein
MRKVAAITRATASMEGAPAPPLKTRDVADQPAMSRE